MVRKGRDRRIFRVWFFDWKMTLSYVLHRNNSFCAVTTCSPKHRIGGGDEVIVSAILDRLLHQSHIFLIAGPGYGRKDKRARSLEPGDRVEDDGANH